MRSSEKKRSFLSEENVRNVPKEILSISLLALENLSVVVDILTVTTQKNHRKSKILSLHFVKSMKVSHVRKEER